MEIFPVVDAAPISNHKAAVVYQERRQQQKKMEKNHEKWKDRVKEQHKTLESNPREDTCPVV